MTNPRPPREPSLLALFRGEAALGAQTLSAGLTSLAGGGSAEALTTLVRAAHSVRGAARIVDVPVIAELAGALEQCLEAAREGELPLTVDLVAAVGESAELIARFGADAADPDALETTHGAAADGLVRALTASPAPAGAAASRGEPVAASPSLRPATDRTLLELFRVDVEQSAQTLSTAILALEADRGHAASWEDVLRAAHSIKGAARIVGLPRFERLAHVMEDRLVAARDANDAIPAPTVEWLLKAADTLGAAAHLAGNDPGELSELEQRCAEHATRTDGPAAGAPRGAPPARRASAPPPRLRSAPPPRGPDGATPDRAPAPRAALAAVPPPADRPERERSAPDSKARVLRVAAQSIDRLMGLAGESLVEARRVASFGTLMGRLRKRQALLGETLARLEHELADPEAAQRLVGEARTLVRDSAALFGEHATEIDSYARRAEDLSERLYREALKSRMRPFSDGTQGFPRLVRDLAKQLGKTVRFELVGAATDVDRDVLDTLEAPLTHLLRNALDHGMETAEERRRAGKPEQGSLRLEARHHAGVLVILVVDDGRGIDPEAIRAKAVKRGLVAETLAKTLSRAELLEFLFLPGFTTTDVVTDVSGRGVGLDVVKSTVESVSGTVRLTTELGVGTTFHLQLPVTRSVARALVTVVGGHSYAFPLLRIDRVLRLPREDIRTLEGRQYFLLDDAHVALIEARQLLGGEAEPGGDDTLSIVVVGEKSQRFGLLVDRFSGEHDLVVRPLDPRLGKVQDIAAAAILANGAPALIVDVDDLVRSIDRAIRSGTLASSGKAAAAEPVGTKRILVVDDSITVREAERQLLVNRGYAVDVAVDGIDALNSIRRTRYDLVITDVDMPRLNGIELVRAIKQDGALRDVPIVIVSYKDRGEDRMRGLEAGANYYLTKSSFHDEKLVEAVEDLIGEAAA